MKSLPERYRSVRAWLIGAVLVFAACAWLQVGYASSDFLLYSRQLGVAAIALVVGSAELAYLVWTAWGEGEKLPAGAAAALGTLGSILVWTGAAGEVTGEDFVMIASGIAAVGLSNGLALIGVVRSTAKTTAKSTTALVIIAVVAYFASLMWSAVP